MANAHIRQKRHCKAVRRAACYAKTKAEMKVVCLQAQKCQQLPAIPEAQGRA